MNLLIIYNMYLKEINIILNTNFINFTNIRLFYKIFFIFDEAIIN
jgi:hypothetical protein